jgi:hypothetical protein
MSIFNTKYNKMPQIYEDISENSFPIVNLLNGNSANLLYINKILTCNTDDIYYIDNQEINLIKVYRDSKASFLMHPFTICRNITNKFNNEKEIYKYKKPAVPEGCNPISKIQIQKQLQKQVRVASSLYTMNKSSLSINSNNLHNLNKSWNNMSDRKEKHGKNDQINTSIKKNEGTDIKHNSYARHLGKIKSQNLKTEQVNNLIMPLNGNKNRKFGISNCISNC